MVPRRKSQIARLPRNVRDHVNEMLDDGATYPEVIAWVAEQGHGQFNEMTISRWHAGGYQDWLSARQRIEERQFKHELAQEQAANNDSTYHDAGINIVAQEFYDAFNRLNFDQLAAKARDNPEKIITLLRVFIHFNRYCLQRDRFRNELTQQQKAEEAGKPKKPV